MSDVAARAGVSQATVSFVLGGNADRLKISQQTRERVLGAARDLGYQRNQIARAMVTGKSRIIGVLTAPHAGENIINILTGAMETTSQKDYLLKVLHLSYGDVDDATIQRCLEWRLAGALVVGLPEAAHRRLHDAFRERNIPVALVDNAPAVTWGFRVRSDDHQGIRQAVTHLTSLGHRRIAFLGGPFTVLSQWREQSFQAEMQERGLSVPAHWVRYTEWHKQSVIEEQVRGLFADSHEELPTAIVCAADTIAMVVLRIARSLGLRLPDDLSVTGYSNATLSEFADPSLTTVDQSFHEMGRIAASQVIRLAECGESTGSLVAGEDAENNGLEPSDVLHEIQIPTRLITRGSTTSPGVRPVLKSRGDTS